MLTRSKRNLLKVKTLLTLIERNITIKETFRRHFSLLNKLNHSPACTCVAAFLMAENIHEFQLMYSQQKRIFLNSCNHDPTVYGPVLNCKCNSLTSSIVIVNISDR